MGGSCPGLVVQGRIIQGKMSWGQNSRGRLPWRNFMEKIVERETFQGIKVRKVIALGEFHRGQLSREFFFFFFFYLGFLLRTFTIHRTEGEGGGYFFKSSLPIPPASQTLRHYPSRYYRELASARS